LLSMPQVFTSSDSSEDPLRDVAAKMQHQVADTVGRVIRSPPDVLILQTLETALDLWQKVRRQQRPGLLEENGSNIFHGRRQKKRAGPKTRPVNPVRSRPWPDPSDFGSVRL